MNSFFIKKDRIMKYLKFLLLSSVLFSSVSFAQTLDIKQVTKVIEPKTLNANFRRIGLELSSTDVKNAIYYKDSPVSQLNADSQTLIKGIFDFVLEYETNYFRWDNSVYAEYAETKLKPADEPADTDESADKILFSTNYTQKIWDLKYGSLGPFFDGAYQTEFTRNNGAPRMSVIRGKVGLKLFDGLVFKDLYLAGVTEYDATYSPNVNKTAGEIGFRIEKEIRDGVKFSTDGYYRRYFSFSEYETEDLRYDLNLTARMDVKLNGYLSVGPYLSYRRAHARGTPVAASNFMVGLSFSYSDLFNLIKKDEK